MNKEYFEFLNKLNKDLDGLGFNKYDICEKFEEMYISWLGGDILREKSFYVKTRYGLTKKPVYVFNSYEITRYIFEYKAKYDNITLEDMLKNYDIGIIVVEEDSHDYIYFDIPLNVLKYFDKYGVDLVLCDELQKRHESIFSRSVSINLVKRVNIIYQIKEYLRINPTYESKRELLDTKDNIFTFLDKKYGKVNLFGHAVYGRDIRSCLYFFIQANYVEPSDRIVLQFIDDILDNSFIYDILKIIWDNSNKKMTLIELNDIIHSFLLGLKLKEESLKEVCEQKDISKTQLVYRLINGIPYTEALNEGIEERKLYGLCYDEECYELENYLDNIVLYSNLI